MADLLHIMSIRGMYTHMVMLVVTTFVPARQLCVCGCVCEAHDTYTVTDLLHIIRGMHIIISTCMHTVTLVHVTVTCLDLPRMLRLEIALLYSCKLHIYVCLHVG